MTEMSQADSASSQANERAVYEIGFHIIPSLSEEEAISLAQAIRAEVNKAGGEIIGEGAPQKIALAYTVIRPVSGSRSERFDNAYFGWVKFYAEAPAIDALHKAVREKKEVLRTLCVETVKEDITAQPRRAVFASDRLEGKTIEKRTDAQEKKGEVSEEELDKSIEALVS